MADQPTLPPRPYRSLPEPAKAGDPVYRKGQYAQMRADNQRQLEAEPVRTVSTDAQAARSTSKSPLEPYRAINRTLTAATRKVRSAR